MWETMRFKDMVTGLTRDMEIMNKMNIQYQHLIANLEADKQNFTKEVKRKERQRNQWI